MFYSLVTFEPAPVSLMPWQANSPATDGMQHSCVSFSFPCLKLRGQRNTRLKVDRIIGKVNDHFHENQLFVMCPALFPVPQWRINIYWVNKWSNLKHKGKYNFNRHLKSLWNTSYYVNLKFENNRIYVLNLCAIIFKRRHGYKN